MTDMNLVHNRTVWMDIPVSDLDRAASFYRSVLDIEVNKHQFDGVSFCVLEHHMGNGGCLVINPKEISATHGILIYLNVNGRIRDAVAKAEIKGGKIIQHVHAIGPHGFRAVIIDSEGNRLALHSNADV
jgi:predicted enzyme related to lactoylglutathione lyase